MADSMFPQMGPTASRRSVLGAMLPSLAVVPFARIGTPARADAASATAVSSTGLAGTVVSVADHGATGDGSTDDTQAFLDAMQAAAAGGPGSVVYVPIPATAYRISDYLPIGKWISFQVVGQDWQKTIIRQSADNVPIFAFTEDDTQSVEITGLRLEYVNPQNATDHPHSVAVARLNRDGASGSCGLYHHRYRDLKIVNAAFGFGVIREVAGDDSVNPWWGCTWERVYFKGIGRSAIRLNLGTTGAPVNVFRDIKVFNFFDSGVVNDGAGACLDLKGEAVIDGLDVEQWNDRILQHSSGNYLVARGIHIEHHKVTGSPGNRVIDLAGGVQAVVEGFNYGTHSAGDGFTGSRDVFYVGSGTSLSLSGGALSTTPVSGSNHAVKVAPNAQAVVEASGIRFSKGTSLYAAGDGTIASLATVDGAPPVLKTGDELPVAAEALRGRQYVVPGGAGTADRLVTCLKSADDSYGWAA